MRSIHVQILRSAKGRLMCFGRDRVRSAACVLRCHSELAGAYWGFVDSRYRASPAAPWKASMRGGEEGGGGERPPVVETTPIDRRTSDAQDHRIVCLCARVDFGSGRGSVASNTQAPVATPTHVRIDTSEITMTPNQLPSEHYQDFSVIFH